MLRYIIVTLPGFLSLFTNMAYAQEVASAFRYPVTASGLSVGSTYTYSQDYRDPISNYTHDGADFDYGCGEPIYAVADGQVEQSDYLVSYDGNGNEIPNTGWGNLVRIKHSMPDGTERYSQYAHLEDRYVVENETVSYGQQIGIMGTTGYSTGCHLHFMIITVSNTRGCGYFSSGGSCMSSWTEEQYWSTFVDPVDFLDEHLGSSSSSAFTAIDAKADELWGLNLIATETQDISLDTTLRDPYYVEYWTGGQWGEVLLTYDEGNEYQDDRAYVVRGGFLEYREASDPSDMGPPLGDELDSTQTDWYTAYDSYCTGDLGYTEPEECIELFCGSSATYTSVQRFQYVTLCYNPSVGVECDPKWEVEHESMNPACSREAEAVTATSATTPSESDLLVYNSTIYWVHNGSTHGIVSSEMFEACGFDWADPYPVSEDMFNSLPQGDTVHDPVSCGAVVDGTLVDQGGTVYEYWAEDASWHGYPSTLVFDACLNDWNQVETMTSSVFSTITIGSVIGNSVDCGVLNPGDLVHWNGTVYRITEGSLKRGFTSSDVFNACAYDWDLVTYLANEDYPIVTTLQDGSAISSTSDCANITGDLVHWEWTGTVYYLTGTGYKRGVTSVEAMASCGFDWNQVRYVTNDNGAVVWTLGDEAAITGNGDCP